MSVALQPFAKGHSAESDFVVLADPRGALDLSRGEVIRLCHPRSGLGGEGVLRAVRTAAVPEAAHLAAEAEWFMDYRGADGSTGGMCADGLLVFARYLVDSGRARPGTLNIATRAGCRQVQVAPAPHGLPAAVTVTMGYAVFPGTADVDLTVAGRRRPAHLVDLLDPVDLVEAGSVHAVVFVDDLAHAGDLHTAPAVTPIAAHPLGVPVDFVQTLGLYHLAVRVHAGGGGESRVCGTSACAVVAAARRRAVFYPAADYRVDFPGGTLTVTVRKDGPMDLTGSAAIVAEGTVRLRGETAPVDPPGLSVGPGGRADAARPVSAGHRGRPVRHGTADR